MKQYILDTNAILRFLTNDIPKQAQAVKEYFLQAQKKEINIQVSEIVIIEVVFQLEHWYKLERSDIAKIVGDFLSVEWIGIASRKSILEALSLYKMHSIDFVDTVLWTTAKGTKSKILSFDKDFLKLGKEFVEKPSK